MSAYLSKNDRVNVIFLPVNAIVGHLSLEKDHIMPNVKELLGLISVTIYLSLKQLSVNLYYNWPFVSQSTNNSWCFCSKTWLVQPVSVLLWAFGVLTACILWYSAKVCGMFFLDVFLFVLCTSDMFKREKRKVCRWSLHLLKCHIS